MQKRILTNNTIIDDIADTIRQRAQLPLFVAEGTAIEKLGRIRSIPYLAHCYQELSSVKQNLFIFGHAASDNDIHIYDAICHSHIKRIFVCVHEPKINLQEMRERFARYVERRKNIEWQYVDAATAKVWG